MYVIPEGTTSKEVDAIVGRHVCGQCGRKTAAFLNPVTKERYIACSDVAHDAASIVKEFTPPKGEDTLNQEKQRRIDNVTETHGVDAAQMLMAKGLPLSGMLTEEQATEVLTTIWRDAPEIEVWKAAKVCHDFGLHPLLKHLYLIKYGTSWTMVLGIGATRLMMSRRGAFGYTDNTPRIMTDDEQKAIFGDVDKANIVAITKLRTATGLEAQGYGKYPKTAGHFQGEDKGNTRANMAFIRSERNAFSRLNPDALPQGVDVVDERYQDTPSGPVNTTTGELPPNGEFHETEGELPFTEPPAGDVGEVKDTTPEKPKRATKKATTPEVRSDSQPCSDEQQEAIKNALKAAGMAMPDIDKQFNGVREWGVANLRDLTTLRAQIVLDWVATRVGDKEAAEKEAAK